MFCGIGTIRLGMEQAGHECVYSIEWDKWKRKIYSIIHGGEPDAADIRTVNGGGLPGSDCWCFGFPCQDISVAGKQLGFAGQRSSLFFEVMRMLREIKEEDKPRYLFIENVKNLFSVNSGWDFYNLLYTMDEIGYDAEWQLLNSKDFGVPQNRERIFIIGHLRGRSTRQVFPIRESNTKFNLPHDQINNFSLDKDNCFSAIDASYYKGYGIRGNKCRAIVKACLTPDRAEKRQNGRRFKNQGEPMFTLTKQDIHGVWIKEATKKGYSEAEEGDSINLAVPGSKTRRGRVGKGIANTLDTSCNQGTLSGGRIRRLTPKECWRLQGIPDDITDKVINAGISDTQMYKGAGDACTVNVIYEIARRLK
ncbi:DNA cytosine methyltransferase [Clostridium botulinum]|nr:DNA cytosine methyltransferase [Clostridium botulinum]